jgi:hypothetical protein
MPGKYTIKDVWRCGVKRWLVLIDDRESARFELKREAVQYVLEQERKEKQEKA